MTPCGFIPRLLCTSHECVSGGLTNALSFATYSDRPLDDGLCCWIPFAMGHVWVLHLTSFGGCLCTLLLAESKTNIV